MKAEESKIQQACVRWFKYQYPRLLIFAVPNGGSRNKIEASKLKREGVLAGVSDLILGLPNKILFVEMKNEKGRQSDTQKEFESKVKELGFDYQICRSFDEFKEVVERNV